MRMYLNFFLISLSCSFDYSNNRIANSGGSNNLFFAKFTIAIALVNKNWTQILNITSV